MDSKNIQPLSEATQRLFDSVYFLSKEINLDEANRAIADGADVNAVNEMGNSILHDAIRNAMKHKNTTIIEKIVQHPDINVNALDDSEWNYFHYLIQYYRGSSAKEAATKIISLLLEKGGNPHLRKNNGRSPLIMAAKKTGCGSLVDPLKKAEEKWVLINAHAKEKKPDYLSQVSSDKWNACKAEIEEMKENDGLLYKFLKAQSINEQLHVLNEKTWSDQFSHLNKKYQEYAKFLTDKVDTAKRKVFQINNKEIIDALSKYYEQDLSNSTQIEIKELLENCDIDGAAIKVDDCINLNDKMFMPSTLKAKAFAEIVNGNLSTKEYSSKQHLKNKNIQQQGPEVNTKLKSIEKPLFAQRQLQEPSLN